MVPDDILPAQQENILRHLKIFKNRFGHLRAGWRILIYLVFIVLLYKLIDTFVNSVLIIHGENLSDYELLLNRFINKFFQLVLVFIPAIVLLKWVDKRPIPLLGIGFYNGTLRELFIGMAIGFILVSVSVLILWITGWVSFSFNTFSLDLVIYLLCVLLIFLISAAYEEILFRGYIFQALIEGSNFWIALGIYSLIFGAVHLSNEGITIFSITVTIMAGVFLGIIYFKTRALWMCIGVHFIWNWTMGPVFGMGISDSNFLRKSIFTYSPAESYFFHGQDIMSEILLGVMLLALTIFLWRAKWLKPAEYNRDLWSHYPSKYGTDPEMDQ